MYLMEEDTLRVIEQVKNEADYFSKGKLISYLIKQKKVRVKDVAEALKMKPSYVCHFMRLAKLSEVVMDGYYSKLITISHLFVISLLKSQEDMVEIYEQVLRDSLTVKQTEELVRKKLNGVSSEGEYVQDSEVQDAEEKIGAAYQGTAKVIQTRIKTKVLIEWTGSRKERLQKVSSFLKHAGKTS